MGRFAAKRSPSFQPLRNKAGLLRTANLPQKDERANAAGPDENTTKNEHETRQRGTARRGRNDADRRLDGSSGCLHLSGHKRRQRFRPRRTTDFGGRRRRGACPVSLRRRRRRRHDLRCFICRRRLRYVCHRRNGRRGNSRGNRIGYLRPSHDQCPRHIDCRRFRFCFDIALSDHLPQRLARR